MNIPIDYCCEKESKNYSRKWDKNTEWQLIPSLKAKEIRFEEEFNFVVEKNDGCVFFGMNSSYVPKNHKERRLQKVD